MEKKSEMKQVKSDDQPATSEEKQDFPPVVYLNVGGTTFPTNLTTLGKYPDSKLAAMFSGKEPIDQDKDGNYFIDRNGDHFGHILEFMENEQNIPPNKFLLKVLKEAKHYEILKLVETLEKLPYVQAWNEILESTQKAADQYQNILTRVLEIALTNVQNHETKSGVSQSSVLLISYKVGEPLRGNVLVDSLCELENKLIPNSYKKYKNKSVLIEEENNFGELCNTLVKVLAFEGFHATSYDYHEYKNDLQVVFIRKPCTRTGTMILNLEWNSI